MLQERHEALSESFLPLCCETKALNCGGNGTERKPSTPGEGAGMCWAQDFSTGGWAGTLRRLHVGYQEHSIWL